MQQQRYYMMVSWGIILVTHSKFSAPISCIKDIFSKSLCKVCGKMWLDFFRCRFHWWPHLDFNQHYPKLEMFSVLLAGIHFNLRGEQSNWVLH